ncbi:MAG: ThuA domain-containing protein [Armatimonadetes bacterium]|nr:MAG: ThuA domain-containing protein [Armatimonadota bacterium]
MSILTSLLATCLVLANPTTEAGNGKLNVLVFSKTASFRHDSIPEGQEMFRRMASAEGFNVSFTELSARFTDEALAQVDVLVFLLTTGDVLNDAQQGAMERFVRRGGGYLGIHAASDTEYDWPWYGKLVGAYFLSHPAIQKATLHIEQPDHPTVSHLPKTWVRTDEWYDFRSNPRSSVNVLMRIDEATYNGGRMGADHPVTWCHEFEGGRAWYTALGHTKESYSESEFVEMIRRALRWVAKR